MHLREMARKLDRLAAADGIPDPDPAIIETWRRSFKEYEMVAKRYKRDGEWVSAMAYDALAEMYSRACEENDRLRSLLAAAGEECDKGTGEI